MRAERERWRDVLSPDFLETTEAIVRCAQEQRDQEFWEKCVLANITGRKATEIDPKATAAMADALCILRKERNQR